ncbi:hypothetical protein LTR16_007776, partial [Cryomyces antarcticus]
ADSVFSGISTFGRLPYHPCLANDDVKYDIAFIGAPFDTGTSYRPGARFGPNGIRQGSRRLNLYDTWRPKVFGGSPTHQASINHGTYFYHAAQEGLLANDTNIHAGIRTTLSGLSDYENDGYCGFEIVEARELRTIVRGLEGINLVAADIVE